MSNAPAPSECSEWTLVTDNEKRDEEKSTTELDWNDSDLNVLIEKLRVETSRNEQLSTRVNQLTEQNDQLEDLNSSLIEGNLILENDWILLMRKQSKLSQRKPNTALPITKLRRKILQSGLK